eukprot:PhF_6_TR4968/c0_g1_i1/m.7039
MHSPYHYPHHPGHHHMHMHPQMMPPPYYQQPPMPSYYPEDMMSQEGIYSTLAVEVTPQMASILLDEYFRITPTMPTMSYRKVVTDLKDRAGYFADHILHTVQQEDYCREALKSALKNRMDLNGMPTDEFQLSNIVSQRNRAQILELILDDAELARLLSNGYMQPHATPSPGANMTSNSPYRSARAAPAPAPAPLQHFVSQEDRHQQPSQPEVRTPGSLASVPSWASLSSSWADEVEDNDGDDDDDLGMDDMLEIAKQSMEAQESSLSEFDLFLNSLGLLHLSTVFKENLKISDIPSLRRGLHLVNFRKYVPLAADRERIQAAVEAHVPKTAPTGPKTTNYVAPSGNAKRPPNHPKPQSSRAWDEAKEQNRTVHVRNIHTLEDEQIRKYFSAFGEVLDVRYVYDQGNFLGYGFVMFAQPQQAEFTLQHQGPHVIEAVTIQVKPVTNSKVVPPVNNYSNNTTNSPTQRPFQQYSPSTQQPPVCRFYKTQQGCKFGTSCRSQHI